MWLILLLLGVSQNLSPTNLWIDNTHQDFQAGKEYYYVQGDTAKVWDVNQLRTWQVGAYWWAPKYGGLKILGRDLDIDDNGYKDVILSWNWYANDTSNNIYIYWNYGDSFSTVPTYLSSNPYGDVQGIHIADLNNDGYEDILAGAGCYSQTSFIFWGTQNPTIFIKDSVKTDYLIYGAQSIYPIDLNRDGYLDLWIDGYNKVFVLYGPNIRYRNPDMIINFPNAGCVQHPFFADINNDTYLDVILGADGSSVLTIAFGPDFAVKQQLPSDEPWVVKAADLNKDGYLDLLSAAAGCNYVYWGSAQGFSSSNRDTFYGPDEGGCAIADLNNDGNLDFIAGEINGGWNSGNSYVRYGPNYHTNYQILPGGSVVVADWNNDGYQDYLMYWFDPGAKLFWNQGGRFAGNNYTYFRSRADDGIVEDFGNIWDRSNKERFLSRILKCPFECSPYNSHSASNQTGFYVGVYGNQPIGVRVTIDVRTSSDGVNWINWFSPTGSPPQGAIVGGWISNQNYYCQYRLIAQLDYHRTTLFEIDSVKGFSDKVKHFATKDAPLTRTPQEEIRINGNNVNLNLLSNAKLVVYDVSGRLTQSQTLGIGEHVIPVANSQGVYIVNIVTKFNTFRKKVIVVK